jgi:hypothetical protein
VLLATGVSGQNPGQVFSSDRRAYGLDIVILDLFVAAALPQIFKKEENRKAKILPQP